MMSSVLLLSSCTQTTYMGTSIGAQIGNIVGTSIEAFGDRHGVMGSLIGTVAGAAIGYGVSSAIENVTHKKTANQTEDNDWETSDDKDNDGYGFDSEVIVGDPVSKRDISISNKSFYDSDGDGMISKYEIISIVFDVTNNSKTDLRSVNLNVTADRSQSDYYLISPSKTVSLTAGQTLRYTAKVKAKANISELLRAEFVLHATASGNSDVTEVIKIKVKD